MERGADLHTAQLMPLPLTVSCFSKIQIGFTFLVLAHPGSPGQRDVKRVCVCVVVVLQTKMFSITFSMHCNDSKTEKWSVTSGQIDHNGIIPTTCYKWVFLFQPITWPRHSQNEYTVYRCLGKSGTCTLCITYLLNHAFIHAEPQSMFYFA